jgi:hypothetical protein
MVPERFVMFPAVAASALVADRYWTDQPVRSTGASVGL